MHELLSTTFGIASCLGFNAQSPCDLQERAPHLCRPNRHRPWLPKARQHSSSELKCPHFPSERFAALAPQAITWPPPLSRSSPQGGICLATSPLEFSTNPVLLFTFSKCSTSPVLLLTFSNLSYLADFSAVVVTAAPDRAPKRDATIPPVLLLADPRVVP